MCVCTCMHRRLCLCTCASLFSMCTRAHMFTHLPYCFHWSPSGGHTGLAQPMSQPDAWLLDSSISGLRSIHYTVRTYPGSNDIIIPACQPAEPFCLCTLYTLVWMHVKTTAWAKLTVLALNGPIYNRRTHTYTKRTNGTKTGKIFGKICWNSQSFYGIKGKDGVTLNIFLLCLFKVGLSFLINCSSFRTRMYFYYFMKYEKFLCFWLRKSPLSAKASNNISYYYSFLEGKQPVIGVGCRPEHCSNRPTVFAWNKWIGPHSAEIHVWIV